MKRSFSLILLFIIALIFIFTGCAGMKPIFEPKEPYCTEAEQADSMIYEHLNPGDVDFLLQGTLAIHLDKHEENAPKIKKTLLALRALVEKGMSYDALQGYVAKHLGRLSAVVLSRAFENFKGIQVPLSVCDKRLTLGEIDNLIALCDMIGARLIFNIEPASA